MASIWDLISSGREAYNQGEIPAPQGAAPRVANYQQPKLNPNLKRGSIAPIGYDDEGNAEWAIPQGLLDIGESIARMSEASNPYTPFPYENYGDITGDALNVGVLGGATSFATKGVPKGALASGLSKQAKDPKDRTEAFKIAQKNAALPVEKGGLGLPKDNTAADRAKAMGFDVDAYHGTQNDFQIIDPEKFGQSKALLGEAFYSSTGTKRPHSYIGPEKQGQIMPVSVKSEGMIDLTKPIGQDGLSKIAKVMEDAGAKVRLRDGDLLVEMGEKSAFIDGYSPFDFGLKRLKEGFGVENMTNILKEAGYSGVIGPEGAGTQVLAHYKPSAIRSRFAAFDPARAESADILAANPELMGLLGAARQKEEEQRGLLNGY